MISNAEEWTKRVEVARRCLALGLDTPRAVAEALRRAGLISEGLSPDAVRMAATRALRAARHSEDEQPGLLAPTVEEAREEFRTRMLTDREWLVARSEEARSAGDAAAAVSARRAAIDAAVKLARACGVDTEAVPPAPREETGREVDWSGLDDDERERVTRELMKALALLDPNARQALEMIDRDEEEPTN